MKHLFLLTVFILIAIVSGCNKISRTETANDQIKNDSVLTVNDTLKSSLNAGGEKGNGLENGLKEESKKTETVSSENIAAYKGKHVIVKGVVSQIISKDKVTYLNIDHKFPKNKLCAVIFNDKKNLFSNINKLEGKQVLIEGNVTNFKDKLEIILTDPAMLRLNSENQ